jgi:hypothetical protein
MLEKYLQRQKKADPLNYRNPPSPLTFSVTNLNSFPPSRLHLLLDRPSPPCSSHRARFLHWLTSNTSSTVQPSTTASTPVPVTRTHPRTESSRSSRRCRPMLRREESETAEPQKESRRWRSCGQPRERTSVAVSESAQQKDRGCVSRLPSERGEMIWEGKGVDWRRNGDLPDRAL